MSCAKCVGAVPLAGLSRRELLNRFGMGLGGIAVANLINPAALIASGSDGQDRGVLNGQFHVPPKAKRIIYLFMAGGPSQMETFDYKPILRARNGEQLPDSVRQGQRLTGMIFWAARNRGPLALPGQYQVRLTADGEVQTQPAEVRLDPRVKDVSPADLQKRFELASEIQTKVSQANDAVLLIRGVRTQIDDALKKTSDAGIRRSGEEVERKLAAIEGRKIGRAHV